MATTTMPIPTTPVSSDLPLDRQPRGLPVSREVWPSFPPRYAFDGAAVPVAHVAPGETVVVHTADCFDGRLVSEEQAPSATVGPDLNPVTGPIFVDGAEPGDTLAVRIGAIEATRDWAVSCLLPGCGALAADPLSSGLPAPLPERVWVYRRTPSGGFAWRDRWDVPWAPFFGTIGVAPVGRAVASTDLGPHGGNLDVPEVTTGATLYLPVHHPGALFSVGDAHAAQGQGELGGPALETTARGTFTFGLVKGETIACPRVASAEAIMTVGIAPAMEDAARIAAAELVGWLARDHGFDPLDAYQLLTQVGGLHVANMVNAAHSVVASCLKRYLQRTPRTAAAQPVAGRPIVAPRPPLPRGERPWFVG